MKKRGNNNFNDGHYELNSFAEKFFKDMFPDPYIHTGDGISHILNESAQVAQENPEVENKTYIVSFPARIVTVVTIDKGMVTCFDRGYVEKKAG